MGRLRISAISYLNTAPLMWDFEHGNTRDFQISYTVPSQCAAHLQTAKADIGIIPAAAYATVTDLLVLPNVAIASKAPVRSILLLSKVPVEQANSVALDSSSLTSVALTKVLFSRWWGGVRQYSSAPPDIKQMLEHQDAGLLIGDPALRANHSGYFAYDLAEEWIRFTGKPFVFAFWAVREDAVPSAPGSDLAEIFQQSRDHGLQPHSLDQIGREWAPRIGLAEEAVRRYLTENIYYHLDAACLDGLRLFYRYAEECGALPPAPDLHFLETAKASSK